MTAPIIEPVTLDCSQWNCNNFEDDPDDTGIDFALLAEKADTVIIRLSVGLQEDLRGEQIYAGLLPFVLAGKVKVAFYHGHIEWLDAHAQATFFAELCEGKLFVFVMADFERDSSGLSQLVLAQRYNNFLLALAAELGIPVYDIVVYTAMWFWDPNIGVVMQTFFCKFRLIFAQYTLNFSYLLIPSSWKNTQTPWWKHQFSADGNGMGPTFGFPGDDIDMNRNNPALPIPPDPDPTPIPPPADCEPRPGVIKQDAWLRTATKVTLTYPPTGTRIMVLGEGLPVMVIRELPPAGGYGWLLLFVPSAGLYGVTAKHLVEVE